MINFVVVDDNTSHRKRIVSTIVSKMMSNQIDFNIDEFNDYSNQLLKTVQFDYRTDEHIKMKEEILFIFQI